MNENAISVIGDTTEEFPVLKAFQQYIDAEQAKARKRMIMLCIFFGCLMTVMIVVFLIVLNGMSQQNQRKTDQLIEYMMKDRERQSEYIVRQAATVQSSTAQTPTPPIPPATTSIAAQPFAQPAVDNSQINQLNEKIEQMQRKLDYAHSREKEIKDKENNANVMEIKRLKALLELEREKNSMERERKRQEELEEYRRKHYPEFYEKKLPTSVSSEEGSLLPKLTSLDELAAVDYLEEEPAKKTSSTRSEVEDADDLWQIPNE